MGHELTGALSERQHNEALMPVTVGAPYRVPSYAYVNWGLTYKDESQADEAYRREWGAGNAEQFALVSRAITEAGFDDFPKLLQRQTGEIVALLLKTRTDESQLRIMDIGAGPGFSALAIIEALPLEMQSRTTMILVDPSEKSLEAAGQLMKAKNIKYEVLHGADSEVLNAVEQGSIDVLTGVASVHHHAKIPFDKYFGVLRHGGFAVFADWHQPIWEHPGSVYRFLERFDWLEREKGLKHWLDTYPNAKNIPPLPESPVDREAIEQISRFWETYARIARESDLGPNAIWPLEGHRPVARYVEAMQEVGFKLDTRDIQSALINSPNVTENPHQILPDSSLLQVTVGQK